MLGGWSVDIQRNGSSDEPWLSGSRYILSALDDYCSIEHLEDEFEKKPASNDGK